MNQRQKNKKVFVGIAKEDRRFFAQCEEYLKLSRSLSKDGVLASYIHEIHMDRKVLAKLGHRYNFKIIKEPFMENKDEFSFHLKGVRFFCICSKSEQVKYFPEFTKKTSTSIWVDGEEYEKKTNKDGRPS